MGTDSKKKDTISQETGTSDPRYQVFLSFKSTKKDGQPTEDSILAKEVFDYLSSRGIQAFYCTERVGDPNFVKAIDAALRVSQAMVVIAVKAEHFDSRWVRHEWESFFTCFPQPKIFTYVKGVMPEELPPLLRPFTSIQHTGEESLKLLYKNLESIFGKKPYMPPETEGAGEQPEAPNEGKPPNRRRRRITCVIIGILGLLIIFLFYLLIWPLIKKGTDKNVPPPLAGIISSDKSEITNKSITFKDLFPDSGRTRGISLQMDRFPTEVKIQFHSLAEDGVLFLKARGKATFFELLGIKDDQPIMVVIKGRISGTLKCGLRAELETADQMGYEIPTEVDPEGQFEASGQLKPETQSCRIVFERCSGPISGEIILSELTIRR